MNGHLTWKISALISPWKRAWFFNLINLNPFTYIRLLYTRFIWNWPIGSGESFFLKIINIFSLRFFFSVVSPWKGNGTLFVEIWIFITKGCFEEVWLNLIWWFQKRRWKYEVYRQTDGLSTDNRRSGKLVQLR